MTVQSVDFSETLRQAIAESRAVGLDRAAEELEGRVFAAHSTSSEYLGEVGEAVTRFLEANGRELPAGTVA